MMEAYRVTRTDGAPGTDSVTAADYEANRQERFGPGLRGRDGGVTE